MSTGLGILLVTGGARAQLDQILPPPDEPLGSPQRSVRAFSADSWWNTPLPEHAPVDPHSDDILRYLRTDPEAGDGCLKLAGLDDSHWGTPMYFAFPTDTTYDVRTTRYELPP